MLKAWRDWSWKGESEEAGAGLTGTGGSLAEKRTILTGDHHGLIRTTGEKHGSSGSWRRGKKTFAEGEGALWSPQE